MAAEGTIIESPDGSERRILKGGQWLPYNGAVPGVKGGNQKLSPQAQAFLNDLSNKAAAAREVGKLYDNVESSLKKLRPGPYRHSLLLSPAIPEEGGGILDKVGAATIGGVTRLTGAIRPDEVDAFQKVRAAQNAAVLERQLPQKGPQTESDAARMMLADISPGKSMAANRTVIDQGKAKIQREQARAIFYSRWTNKYGSPNAADPKGFTADQVWNQAAEHIVRRLFPPSSQKPVAIKVLSRRKK